jgi:hypothetical protein
VDVDLTFFFVTKGSGSGIVRFLVFVVWWVRG